VIFDVLANVTVLANAFVRTWGLRSCFLRVWDEVKQGDFCFSTLREEMPTPVKEQFRREVNLRWLGRRRPVRRD